MKILVDECVSHHVCTPLRADGHDVLHAVNDLAMASATDRQLMSLASDEYRVLITADTDFPALLALTGAVRHFVPRRWPSSR